MDDDETIRTYDRIASTFAARHFDADLDAARLAFVRAIAEQAGDAGAPGSRVRFRLLDAGCGPGRDARWFHGRRFEVIGVDRSAGMLAEARRRAPGVEFRQADLRHLEFPPASFDGIWCCAALLHLPRVDVPGVLESFNRLLDHGYLWVSVKAGEGEEITTRGYDPADRRRFTYFGRHELELYLERAGFEVREVTGAPPTTTTPHPWLSALAQTKLRSPLLAASALIFDEAGRLLMSERADGRGWDLPGGFVDPDEAPQEAVIREVREETGLEVVVEALLGVYTSPPDPRRGGSGLVVHTFRCRVIGGQLRPTKEALRHDWFAPEVLPSPLASHRIGERIADAAAVRAGRLRAPVVRRHAR